MKDGDSDQDSDENIYEGDDDGNSKDDGNASENEEDCFTMTFQFRICDQDEWEVVDSLVLRAMRSWKWG